MARFRNRKSGVVVSRADGKPALDAARYELLDTEASETTETKKAAPRKRSTKKSDN